MTNKPLVSVIIPTYNRAHLISETLDSVLAQTYANWECIVVDDGSTDNTENMIKNYVAIDHKFKFYNRPENAIKGASSCRNFGLKRASGKYVVFLDSDDLLLPHCLSNRILKAKEVPNLYFWVFPMAVQNNGKQHIISIPKCDDYLKAFLSCNIYWQTMCTLWDIEFLKALNGFNSRYPRLNDPEIHIRAMFHANSNYRVFGDGIYDSVYREAPITNKSAYALNYFKALQLFVPDMCNQLVTHKKRTQKKLLKGYLNHYIKDFERHTPWKNMVALYGVFYRNNVIPFSEYLSSTGNYLLLKLFNVIFKKMKFGY
ncbi:glycosyltransferase family 2 protein [Aestuariibaculum sp. YM273]|uniref:glycosyltransferase family 2 protein n=1 Tax=Aestuariibaculum sp. YM273 TaxID=3070659 RepID=UPI0027DBC3DD|nr:glycosyltransferase family 2 protein [Aestuariibaculum sp. YM273]WMI65827.1 glycosyltransferase family 2 protein [Aestuariibaculum sp. YM273]